MPGVGFVVFFGLVFNDLVTVWIFRMAFMCGVLMAGVQFVVLMLEVGNRRG